MNTAEAQEIGCEILLLGGADMPHCERRDEIFCFPPKPFWSLISPLMLPLLPGFVVGLLPSGKMRHRKNNQEGETRSVRTNLGVCYSDSGPLPACICADLLEERNSWFDCAHWPWSKQGDEGGTCGLGRGPMHPASIQRSKSPHFVHPAKQWLHRRRPRRVQD